MTLSEASAKTKFILKWLGIFLAGLVVLLLIFRVLGALKDAFFPPPQPKPQVYFGKLPPPDFPISSSKQYTYNLDTISGYFPNFPTQVKVYRMLENNPDILGLQKANGLVGNVGFSNAPTKISDNIYQWQDSKGRILTMNITSLSFNMISDFLSNANQPLFTQDIETAKNTALSFLQSIGLMQEDFDSGRTKTDIYSIKNYSIIPATSLSNTQAVQVNFFQRDLNKIPIFYPKFSISPVNFLVGEVGGEAKIVEANYFYQKPSEISSTYPIKTGQSAFEDLKKGKAFVASPSSQFNIPIKDVTLGYYIAERKQPYLLPVFVFEANNGFAAYVNAITDEWVNK